MLDYLPTEDIGQDDGMTFLSCSSYFKMNLVYYRVRDYSIILIVDKTETDHHIFILRLKYYLHGKYSVRREYC